MSFKDTLRNFSFDRLRNLPPRNRWLLLGLLGHPPPLRGRDGVGGFFFDSHARLSACSVFNGVKFLT